MKLLTFTYQAGTNYLIYQCRHCGKFQGKPVINNMKLSCCTKHQLDKLPLYYLIHSTMFIYSLYNTKRDKEYIGVTLTGTHGSEKYQMSIINKDIEDIIFYNENLDLIADIREDGMDAFNIEILEVVGKLSTARIEEELQVRMRRTMAPDGYNETLKCKQLIKQL